MMRNYDEKQQDRKGLKRGGPCGEQVDIFTDLCFCSCFCVKGDRIGTRLFSLMT